ncbi:xylose repressor [Halolactibacillus alkaliphilus]|uniref:Xylose repressor n=1 Tax=Halolactibacillus alkaliphilus TaxID=442899 RepID=A0A511X0S7_9BACI|nr:ROK family protein [Halolactibacillus alkaliphilus]GEN56548.1 xylose repressor [Halolactibacillus alkaliphilus]GGN69313.1 xylose repressor [Halolactibacillus alkaliphilus]SFO75047.1 Sugar kinase of the NBD/HSP70 family, may contain an N-terminal HTH domain [Halolactibacillus alkaliphilus]
MSRTWNQYIVKQENKALVLNTIIEETPISRAKVAQVTGLNKGTVSSLVSELIDNHFVTESGPGASSGGRRPVMLLFNQTAGFTIALDLGVGYIDAALTDLTGSIITKKHMKLHERQFNKVFTYIVDVINNLIEAMPKSPYGLVGIGIGVPGVVNHNGEILLAPNLNWKNIHLEHALHDVFNVPVIVENEANAAAYGEMRFGFKTPPEHMLYLSIGMGIGMGMVLDKTLYTGLNGFAGEMGHITVVKDGINCRCGNTGCFERYASEQALLEQAIKRGLVSGNEEMSVDLLIEKAQANHQEVIQLFKEIGQYIAIGITTMVNLFNPEQILIGNQLSKLSPWIKEDINYYVFRHAIGFHSKRVTVDFTSPEHLSTIKGMASFAIEKFLLSIKEVE